MPCRRRASWCPTAAFPAYRRERTRQHASLNKLADLAPYNRLREEADAARQKLRESGYSGAEYDQLRQAAFDLNRKANQYWEQMLSDLRQED